ncbi:MAG TPA: tRNA (guanosine(46)-N7)-methyltransferase TrmB [Methyloceanibacter sp.]|nr:tRNA (guanosine(46)-N7)-methyltransferase TrmB [Methyloceanibacter sp.]
MAMDGEGESRLLRSYGRRKGKRLSPRKERLLAELLPELRPDLASPAPQDLRTLFAVPVEAVWLEIGFGSGEHLLWQAQHNPKVGIIGCEPFINGAASLLGEIETKGLKNIRVHDGDARDVLAWLPPGSIARAFILFPDPWPKKRQAKRRLVSPELAASLAWVIKPGGELRFASDDGDYAGQALLAINGSGAFEWLARKAVDWRARPADWPETRYERKALSGGKPVYLSWRRC